MSKPRYRIFISSPGDVGSEREEAISVIERQGNRWRNHVAVEFYVWEHEPMLATKGDFQANIESVSDFDLAIFIFRARLGSRLHPQCHLRPDGTAYESGTAYEFETGLQAYKTHGRPQLAVFWRDEVPSIPVEPKDLHDEMQQQWEQLKAFRKKWLFDEAQQSFLRPYTAYSTPADFGEKFDQHLTRLITAFVAEKKAVPAAETRQAVLWTFGSPYRGLNFFDAEHERVFFGRARERDELLETLKSRFGSQGGPFVLIVGASGCGKTSLLRAGVLPWLIRPGIVREVDLWRSIVFRPHDSPRDLLYGLTSLLLTDSGLPELAKCGADARHLRDLLADNPGGFLLLLRQSLSMAAREEQIYAELAREPVVRLVLGLDQLEEVFTLSECDEQQLELFFRAIRLLVETGCVWVAATLRSDLLPSCERFGDLMALKQGLGQYHLLPPSAPQISQIVRSPAEAAGVRFEEDPEKGRLDERICSDALRELGDLPLLEYVLDELYRMGVEEGVLRHSHYEELGGVEGALKKRAEDTFQTLTPDQKASLDSVLRRLVRLEASGEQTLTRAVANYDVVTAEPAALGLVEALVGARLLTVDQNPRGERILMVTHEALLRVWPEIQRWATENRDYLSIRLRLSEALNQWEASGKHDDFLLGAGRPIADAEELLARDAGDLDQNERVYIELSRRKLLQRARARRLFTGVIFLALIAVAIALVFLWNKAKTQEAEAIAERKNAQDILNELLSGSAYFAAGKTDDAEDAYNNASLTASKLSKKDPSNTSWLFDLAVSWQKLGELSVAKLKYDDAETRFSNARVIFEQLIVTDGTDIEVVNFVATSLGIQGDFFKLCNKGDTAKAMYDRSGELYQMLVLLNKENPRWAKELDISHQKAAGIAGGRTGTADTR